jgi:hypothetical protein
LFLAIAEIAGVFVGFGALISLLRDRQEAGRFALHAVIVNGLVALVASLIPVALNEYGLTGRELWGWSSGVFLALCWAAIGATLRNPEIRSATATDARAYPAISIVFWVFLEVPIELPLVLVLFGFAARYAPALYVTALILTLVQAAFMLARVVFSRT